MQSPGRKQSFPVIWSQSCSDLLKGTGGPPWSTESEHYPPSTHTSMHAGLATGQFTTVWNIILCVCYLMHQIFELRQDAQSLFASWVAAVELLQQTPHYLHMQETSFDWSSKRFTVTAHSRSRHNHTWDPGTLMYLNIRLQQQVQLSHVFLQLLHCAKLRSHRVLEAPSEQWRHTVKAHMWAHLKLLLPACNQKFNSGIWAATFCSVSLLPSFQSSFIFFMARFSSSGLKEDRSASSSLQMYTFTAKPFYLFLLLPPTGCTLLEEVLKGAK